MSTMLAVWSVFGQEGSGGALTTDVGRYYGQFAVLLPFLFALALLLWALLNPRIGRIFARIFAVLTIGGGVGVLTWGICAAAMGEEIRSLASVPTLVTAPSEAMGLGAGLLVAGVVALVLSFLGSNRRADADGLL